MTIPKHNSTPVVVLNCRRQGGLGIVRSLGRWGVPVWGIDANRWEAPLFSRYLKGKYCWDFESSTPEESLDFLCRIAQRFGSKPILIPMTDADAVFVSEHASRLREFYLFHALEPELIRALCSKREMFHLAKRHSIPTPNCVFPGCRQDVVNFAKTDNFPVMLKGIDGHLLQKVAGKRMFVVRSAPELLDYYDRFEDPLRPNIMLQDYIPGGDDTVWMFNGYFDERSECLVGMTGKKIHQYPIHTGLTCLGVCLYNGAILDLTRTFMRVIGYRGILDIGFRYDRRDDTYKVLDINPRIGATFRLFVTKNGMDVVRALYLDLSGQRVGADAARESRKWIVEDMDFISTARYLMERKLGLRELMRSYSGIEERAFFAADDPIPFLMMFANAGREALQRAFSKPLSRKRAQASVPGRE